MFKLFPSGKDSYPKEFLEPNKTWFHFQWTGKSFRLIERGLSITNFYQENPSRQTEEKQTTFPEEINIKPSENELAISTRRASTLADTIIKKHEGKEPIFIRCLDSFIRDGNWRQARHSEKGKNKWGN